MEKAESRNNSQSQNDQVSRVTCKGIGNTPLLERIEFSFSIIFMFHISPLPHRKQTAQVLTHCVRTSLLIIMMGWSAPTLWPQEATITINASQPAKQISPDLFGIFFEDINYGADGGLYAELIQNGSFEYQATEQPTWNQLTSWEFVQRGGGKGSCPLEDANPIHANNPHYIRLSVATPGEGVGLANDGFDGIAIKAGETYDVSFFTRQLDPRAQPMPLTARLETADGSCLGEASFEAKGANWNKVSASITAAGTNDNARFVLLAKAKGNIALDNISLFPRKTFHGRPNGLRADLAQTIADLHPKFIRFPGGCVAHGDGIGNIYRWKNTIGPVEQRRGQKNLWRYHQSVGLGYFEYFQFCEDIGAKPLPVIAAGVSCQGSDRMWGVCQQQAIPMEEMPSYIQDILDLIEWANGPVTSQWGAKRAAAGHPEPFHLEYVGIGNEDAITPAFKERFKMIQDAIQKKYPEMIIVGTVGPGPDGKDFTNGWAFARELKTPILDEHYYESPEWFFAHLNRYDDYDPNGAKVYVGEYAAQEKSRHNTLRTAIAEAAYLTSLERNGDVVHLASYAPLLANIKHTQWKPDLIYFTNTRIVPSVNYYVQQMFATNAGDAYFSSTAAEDAKNIAVSAVRDGKTGDFILKLVNSNAKAKRLHLVLSGAGKLVPTAAKTVLAGDPMAENTFEGMSALRPKTGSVPVGKSFDYEAPGTSLSVLRIHEKP